MECCAGTFDKTTVESKNPAGERQRRGTWQRRKVFNEGKVGSLRRWLLNVFGKAYLSSGSGVLDVAGGKGEVSFELLNLNGVPCTVIDPRELCLLRCQKKYSRGYYHRNEVLRGDDTLPIRRERIGPEKQDEGSESSLGPIKHRVTSSLPMHIRAYFHMGGIDDRCVMCSASGKKPLDRTMEMEMETETEVGSSDTNTLPLPLFLHSRELFTAALQESKLASWTEKGLLDPGKDSGPGSDNCSGGTDHVVTYPFIYDNNELELDNFGTNEIIDYDCAVAAVRDCSIIVGMHADQATEHLVEFALRNDKAFALLPCCIYSRQFPTRVSRTGELVTTYAQFVEYLIAKDPLGRIRAVELDFEGKNILLYYVPIAVCRYPQPTVVNDKSSDTGAGAGAGAVSAEDQEDLSTVSVSPIVLLADPACYVPRVVRGVATKAIWRALSAGLKRPDADLYEVQSM